jgi:hypothetical protein
MALAKVVVDKHNPRKLKRKIYARQDGISRL